MVSTKVYQKIHWKFVTITDCQVQISLAKILSGKILLTSCVVFC
jgi:hypothetical protein